MISAEPGPEDPALRLRQRRRDGALVAAAALLGHALVGLWAYPTPLFDKYPRLAAAFAQGRPTVLPSDASPLYLALHLFAGAHARGVVRALQLVAGVATVLAVAAMARRLFGRAAQAGAAVAAAFAAPLVLYEATLEPDALAAALAAGALFAALEDRRPAAAVLAGLGAALRPTLVPFLLLLFFWFWRARAPRQPSEQPAPGRRRAALLWLLGALACAALPAAAVRLRLGGQTSATMSFGQVLWHGNAPEGIGSGDYTPLVKTLEAQAQVAGVAGADLAHESFRALARAGAGRPLTPLGCELYWVGRARAFLLRHPASWLRLEASKLAMLLGPVEIPDIVEVLEAQAVPAPLLPAALLYPLGAVGLLLLAVTRRGRLVAAAALALGLPYLVFKVSARYRLVLLPPAAVGIGAVTAILARALRAGGVRPAVRALRPLGLALVLAAPLVWPPAPHRAAARALRKGLKAAAAYHAGEAWRRAGDLARAGAAFQQAIAQQPSGIEVMDLRGVPWEEPGFFAPLGALYERKLATEPSAGLAFDAGVIAELGGRLEPAIGHFRRAAEGGYYLDHADGGEPSYRAGRLLLRLGRLPEARRELARALAHRPGVLVELAAAEAAARRMGDEAAAGALAEEIDAEHDRASAAYERARARRWAGDPRGALAALEPALAQLPEAALLRWQECRARAELGDAAGALSAYARAIRALPTYPFDEAALDDLFAAAVGRTPGDAELLRLAGEHALRRGRLAEAVRHLRSARAASPALAADPELGAHLSFAEHARAATP